ncbi:MAG: DUF3006 domain-containing protein [Deltaproteobacteria bacterium]|nr:DUF3006 domain-containing protein [Deltaproteobacteria bacterium]
MIVVDRIEGDRAVLVAGDESFSLPVALLPAGTREGDVLALVRDDAATVGRREDAAARLERLRKRTPQGPDSIDL